MSSSIFFPAFVNEYTGKEQQAISVYENNFNHLLTVASGTLNLGLTEFNFQENNFLNDELKSQYISFIFSCSVADILKYHKLKPKFVSGYSMGIYAALYFWGSITFYDGLQLVKNAWENIILSTTGSKYGMGMIVGLKESEISDLIKTCGGLEICNQNNPHTFIISGLWDSVERILIKAKTEGALRASALPVSNPYHSKFVKNAVPAFTTMVNNIIFTNPAYHYVSAIDQKIIDSSDGVRNEVIENICCRMNWYNTMNSILRLGTNSIFECGAGDGLTRNSRFIEGNYKSYSINKLDKFLEIASY